MHNAVLGETMKNVRKHIDFKLATTKTKKLFSIRTKSSYYYVFHRKFISNRNGKNSNIND